MRDFSKRIAEIEVGSKYRNNTFLSFLETTGIRYRLVDKNALNYKPQIDMLKSAWDDYCSLCMIGETINIVGMSYLGNF